MELNTSRAARSAQSVYATTVEAAAAVDESRFSEALQAASAPVEPALLTSAGLSAAHRPDIKTFMDASGASFEDAAELLYGVVGSNTDTRDWQVIMTSGDPVTAARRATGLMYGDPGRPQREDAAYLGEVDTLARSGPFALRVLKNEDGEVLDDGLKLVDANGLLLRDAGRDAAAIRRNAWLFGADIAQAAPLVVRAGEIGAGLQAQLHEAVGSGVAIALASPLRPAAVPAALVADPVTEAAPAVPATVLAASADDVLVGIPDRDEPAETALAPAPAFVDTASVLHTLMKVVEG